MDPLRELLGDSPEFVALLDQARQLLRARSTARRPPPVLLQGETGTGKGLLASALHRASPRVGRPFVDLNCAAVPETLLEAELFGFERGAFTDAHQSKPGLFQLAHRGTLFLDEIGLLPPALQAKLLAVLDGRAVRRLGATRAEQVDVWVLAATNEDLAQAMQRGAFRDDLYHRLAVVTLKLPPLREREADLLLLAERFLARACADYGLPAKSLTAEARVALRGYSWPGNIRELGNVIERAALLTDAEALTPSHLALPAALPARDGGVAPALGGRATPPPARDLMRQHLQSVLVRTGWNISRSAAFLGISRNTVKARIARFGLREPDPAPAGRDASTPPPAPLADGEAQRRSPVIAGRWQSRRLSLLLVRLTAPVDADLSSQQALNSIAEKIRGFGGRVEGLSPAGLCAVFGLEPTDEPAVLAAHSAMVIRNALRRGGPRITQPLSITMGLHAREILVNYGPGAPTLEADGIRHGWNTLDALLAEAEPDRTLATREAAALLRRRFALVPLGQDGTSYGIEGFWHGGPGRAREVGRLAGRRTELALLEGRLALAGRGRGQVIDMIGEAGIGKSRLLLELARSDVARAVTYLEARCSPATESTPFYPLLSILRDTCGVTETDAPDVVRERVTAATREVGLEGPELAAILTQLLATEPAQNPELDPGRLKKRFFGAIRDLLIGRSSLSAPLLIAVEDLHWVDPTSEECLASLVEAMGTAPILLVTTYRPGFRPPWAGQSNVIQLPLLPLSLTESLGLVHGVLDPGAVSDKVVSRILARAEGNPLFLEELSRATLERSAGRSSDHVPATIEEVIGIRIDRLRPRARQLLRTAAVIGREVPMSLLRLVSQLPDEALQESLEHLQRADFLYHTARAPSESGYTFRHGLFQEVAYAGLAAGDRRALHIRALESIERVYADSLGEQIESCARHALAGEARERAVSYSYQAGQKARARSAPAEANNHLRKGLDLLQTLPETLERDRQELDLQTAVGQILLATKGYGAPEVERSYTRALELCQRVGDTGQLASVLTGQWVFHLLRAEYQTTWAIAERLLTLAEAGRRSEFLLEAHVALGMTAIFLGEFVAARHHLELALTFYDSESRRPFFYDTDLGVSSLAYLAWALWFLGYPDQALRRSSEGLALARSRERSATLSVAQALGLVASIHQVRGDARAALEFAEQTIAYSAERGFPYWVALGRITRSWALGEGGERKTGIAQIRESLDSYRATGATLGLTRYLTMLADMHRKDGQAADSLSLLTEAAALVQDTGERYHEAEIHRLQGEVALLGSGPDSARAAELFFERALDVARRQSAKSWELRAVISLARLWRDQGKIAEARALLAPVYSWFTEGMDTADPSEARALLEELARPSRALGA